MFRTSDDAKYPFYGNAMNANNPTVRCETFFRVSHRFVQPCIKKKHILRASNTINFMQQCCAVSTYDRIEADSI